MNSRFRNGKAKSSSAISVEGLLEKGLPSAVDVEKGVLAECLIDDSGASANIVVEKLKVKHFTLERNAAIFKGIERLVKQGAVIDMLTLPEAIKANGDESKVSIAEVSAVLDVATYSGDREQKVNEYIGILVDTYLRRQLIIGLLKASHSLGTNLDESAAEWIIKIQNWLLGLEKQAGQVDVVSLKEIIAERLQAAIDGIQPLVESVPSGFKLIDDASGGFPKGELSIIGGIPAMGKTSFLVNCASAAVAKGKRILVFSLEMTREMIAMRWVCSTKCVPTNEYMAQSFSQSTASKVEGVRDEIDNDAVFIVDEKVSAAQIYGITARYKRTYAIDAIYIDYIQIVSPRHELSGRPFHEQLGMIALDLKFLAKELDVAVVVLSQLKRETDEFDVPEINQLAQSQILEQQAYYVIFLCRDSGYNEDPDIGYVVCAAKKHRNGRTFEGRLQFLKQFTRFQNAEE